MSVPSSVSQPSGLPMDTSSIGPAASPSYKRLLRHVPTVLVLCILGGIALLGHQSGWTLPKFSALNGADDAPSEVWCDAHAVPEEICVECKAAIYPKGKKTGWCKEHRIHECTLCHPEVAQLANPPRATAEELDRVRKAIALTGRPLNNMRCKLHERRIQFASAEIVEKSGVEFIEAWRGPIVESITASGQIQNDPTRTLELSSRVAGTVWRVEKQIGDEVGVGDVLALVDSAEVGKAKADLQHAIAQRELATLTLARKQAAAGAITQQDLQEAKAALREAQLRVAAVEQSLASLGIPVDPEALAGLSDKDLKEQIRYLGLPQETISSLAGKRMSANLVPLRSTIEGLVTRRDVVPGQVVDTHKPLFVITDARRMWLLLDVRTEEASLVAPGQSVRFQPDGGGDEVTAKIDWVSTATDEKTRTVRVRAQLDNPDGRYRALTFGMGRIVLRQESSAVLVPSTAVQSEGCCHIVFVRDKNYAQPDAPKVFHVREVQPGADESGNTELIAGILPGEVVVAKGSGVLRNHLLKNNLGAG
jgi:membrane fusion protein, heavy metal efflux system